MFSRFFAPAFFAFALTTAVGPTIAHAQAGSGLADAETSYRGAVMLEGNVDATFDDYWMGDFNSWDYTQTEYAYWSGNTLYVGAEDENGNGVDAIVEFYWFESSRDRGSDFYVAVIKARNTPNTTDSWYLDTSGNDPVLHVSAETDLDYGTGAFRWDWSVPFENYGMESYGQVNMSASYGASASAEGSAMYAQKYTESGAEAEVDVQAKGYVDADYSVNTNYSVELWSWYTRVRGAPGEMTWDLTCDNFTKDEESAYHEYFLVMQTEEDIPFTIDKLTIGATADEWWWTVWNKFSVEVEGITLSRPVSVDDSDDDSGDDGGDDGLEDTGDDWSWDTGDDGSDDDWNPPYESDDDRADPAGDDEFTQPTRGCTTLPATGLIGVWGLLPLVAILRRRRG